MENVFPSSKIICCNILLSGLINVFHKYVYILKYPGYECELLCFQNSNIFAQITEKICISFFLPPPPPSLCSSLLSQSFKVLNLFVLMKSQTLCTTKEGNAV